MKYILKLSFTLLIGLLMISSISAQPGRGGGPEEFIEREKQGLFKKIEDLSDDQKLLVNGIYDEFAVSLREIFQNRDENTTREIMREKMTALRSEKDDLMFDVLNKEQYAIYTEISSSQRRGGKKTENSSPENNEEN